MKVIAWGPAAPLPCIPSYLTFEGGFTIDRTGNPAEMKDSVPVDVDLENGQWLAVDDSGPLPLTSQEQERDWRVARAQECVRFVQSEAGRGRPLECVAKVQAAVALVGRTVGELQDLLAAKVSPARKST